MIDPSTINALTVFEFVVDPTVEKGKPRATPKPTPITKYLLKDAAPERVVIRCHDEEDLAVARDTLAELTEGS